MRHALTYAGAVVVVFLCVARVFGDGKDVAANCADVTEAEMRAAAADDTNFVVLLNRAGTLGYDAETGHFERAMKCHPTDTATMWVGFLKNRDSSKPGAMIGFRGDAPAPYRTLLAYVSGASGETSHMVTSVAEMRVDRGGNLTLFSLDGTPIELDSKLGAEVRRNMQARRQLGAQANEPTRPAPGSRR